jgi:2-polyprenyl-3-methyl-5-hydroxy-6-metoxy-1,4-benzoquinol methylase
MQRIQRIDPSLIKRVVESIADQHARDDMAVPTYLHRNRLIHWLFWRRLDVAFGLLPTGKLDSVLDFGCGTGVLLPSLATRARHVYGCDLRPEPARALVKHFGLSNVQVLAADELLQIAPASLDCIVSADVLEHIDDLQPLLRAFHALLRPKGRLVISGPTENWLYAIGRKIAGFSGEYHVKDVYDVNKDVLSAGFHVLQKRRLPVNTLPSLFALFEIWSFTRSGS